MHTQIVFIYLQTRNKSTIVKFKTADFKRYQDALQYILKLQAT